MPFQIVDHLEYAPGCCKACGLTRPGRYVDTLEFDEAGARVYYCTPCVQDWALHLGILSGEVTVVERLREPNAEEIGRFVLAAFKAAPTAPPQPQDSSTEARIAHEQEPGPAPKPPTQRRTGTRRKKVPR